MSIFKNIKTTVETFYNSINLMGVELETAQIKCTRQEYRIFQFFKTGIAYTPFEIQELYQKQYPEIPITSIRRAITNLESRGFLKKTESMKAERYGKPNHKWVINQSIFKQAEIDL